MKTKLVKTQAIVPLFRKIETGEQTASEGLDLLADILDENLSFIGVSKNSHNAAQVANLFSAELYPNDPLSKFVAQSIIRGGMPQYSDSPPDEYAVYRGCAVLAVNIANSLQRDAPIVAARAMLDILDKKGYLPDDRDIEE